jgi:hypothetical protein
MEGPIHINYDGKEPDERVEKIEHGKSLNPIEPHVAELLKHYKQANRELDEESKLPETTSERKEEIKKLILQNNESIQELTQVDGESAAA